MLGVCVCAYVLDSTGPHQRANAVETSKAAHGASVPRLLDLGLNGLFLARCVRACVSVCVCMHVRARACLCIITQTQKNACVCARR